MGVTNQAITDIYDALVPETGAPATGRIHPFVGGAFTGTSDALRIMAIGINCYASDTATTKPSWFPAMFAEQKYRFQKAVLRQVALLGRALEGSQMAGGRAFAGKESIYHTNAVKRWVPMSTGKRAHRVPEPLFAEGQLVFRAELDALAAGRVLPDLVVVFGNRPWSYTWRAFADPRPTWAESYQPIPGDLFHHLNRIVVRRGADAVPLVLVKLRHATGARGKGLSPAGLIGHADFKDALAGSWTPRATDPSLPSLA